MIMKNNLIYIELPRGIAPWNQGILLLINVIDIQKRSKIGNDQFWTPINN